MSESQSVSRFEDYIQGRWIIADGAMATLLHQSGQPIRSCFEELNLSSPELIKSVHSAYLQVGARMIQTNTFSGSRVGLERYGLGEQVASINRAAVHVAREAVEETKLANVDPAFVFGTIGSVIDLITATHPNEREDLIKDLVEEQASALLEAQVDGILLETYPELHEMESALKTVRRLTDLPIIANLSPVVVGVTRDGFRIEEAFKSLKALGATVVGLNCRLGLSGILRTYEMTPLEEKTIYSAVPNGGLLHMEEGAYSYTANANYFAEMGAELVKTGVRVIGGCCGTTPEHIKALKIQLDGLDLTKERGHRAASPVSSSVVIQRDFMPVAHDHTGAPNVSLIEKAKTETTIVVELDPPRVLNIDKYLKGAEALHQAGVDAITLADNSLGTVRVSNMALARLLKEKGIEPLVHVACRDRNLIGQQSHLMGLHILGIHHILLVTGDPSKFGDLPGATSVYDVSSTELTRMVKQLNRGMAFSGQPLKNEAKFIVGTSFNPHVNNFNKAIDRLKRKLDSGADYVMTQPIFDARLFEKLSRATEAFDTPVFAGIMPLTSSRNAQFLHHEVPGITLTDEILERMKRAPDETAYEEGLYIAEELIKEATTHFNGIYLVTPFLRFELSVRLTQFTKQLVSKGHSRM